MHEARIGTVEHHGLPRAFESPLERGKETQACVVFDTRESLKDIQVFERHL